MNTRPTARMFAPEAWGQVDIFKQFYPATYNFKPHMKQVISGVDSHFHKALTFNNLAKKLVPNMLIDQEELNTNGFTSAGNSQEVSAVIEEVFTELYSSVDCARQVIVAVYDKCQGMPKDSTRKLFRYAKEELLRDDFPRQLKIALQQTDWYEELRDIRDALTHANIGRSRQDPLTKSVSYSHDGLRGGTLHFTDVFAKIDTFIKGVNAFLGAVFNFLNTGLSKTPIDVPCGIFFGRFYLRKIRYAEKIDFHSGACQSRQWFDSLPDFCCPFSKECGAYNRDVAAI